jgi:UDP-glucose 4-epimerase
VYGDTDQIMDESHPLNARTMYGAGKIAGEFFLRAFHEMYKLDYVILRYMNVYGPRQEGGLVMSVLNRIKQNQPPVIHGDGKQSFDFVDVTDIARANLLAMQSDVTDQAFNVGSGTEASVKEIVELLLELIGSNMHPVYEPAGQVLMFRRVGSNEKARKLLGFQAQVSLREGLRRVIKNYKASSN